jgi:hypothetical protein
MWVRLFQPASDNTRRRRALLADPAPRGGRKLGQALPVPASKVTVYTSAPPGAEVPPLPPGKVSVHNAPVGGQTDGPVILPLWEDPVLQHQMEAAVRAQWQLAADVDADPDKVRISGLSTHSMARHLPRCCPFIRQRRLVLEVPCTTSPAIPALPPCVPLMTWPLPPARAPQVPATAFEPNATNPLGMDPMLLAASFYAALAMESDCNYDGDGCDLFPTGEAHAAGTAGCYSWECRGRAPALPLSDPRSGWQCPRWGACQACVVAS